MKKIIDKAVTLVAGRGYVSTQTLMCDRLRIISKPGIPSEWSTYGQHFFVLQFADDSESAIPLYLRDTNKTQQGRILWHYDPVMLEATDTVTTVGYHYEVHEFPTMLGWKSSYKISHVTLHRGAGITIEDLSLSLSL